MPITDNLFTDAELETAITANPALISEIEKVVTKKGGFLAPDATKKTEYESNIATAQRGEVTSKIAGHVEKYVDETTGIKKSTADEKWYKYNERVVKTLADENKANKAELKRLKDSTDLNAAERQRIVELENLSKSRETEIEQLKTSHQNELSQERTKNKIFGAIGRVDAKIKKDLDPELVALKREQVISGMLNSAKTNKDGKTVFFGADGKARTNADASFMTEEQVYTLEMDKYLEKAPNQGGAGGSGEGNADIVTPGQFKTQQELDLYLGERGLTQGTKEFTAEAKRLGRAKLPLQ
jgi:hypothetical protein